MPADNMTAVAALGTGPLGDGIREQEIAAFFLSGWARQRDYRHGEIIFAADDVPDRLYVLVSGRVLLRHETADGIRLAAAEIGAPGDVIAETALFRAPLPYGFSAEALADSSLIEIARGLFSGSAAASYQPQGAAATPAARRAAALITRNLLRLMAARNVRLERRARILSGENLSQKIARYLLVPPVPDAARADDLAAYLAVPPSKLKAELEAMAAQDAIAVSGRLIKIKNSAALGAFV